MSLFIKSLKSLFKPLSQVAWTLTTFVVYYSTPQYVVSPLGGGSGPVGVTPTDVRHLLPPGVSSGNNRLSHIPPTRVRVALLCKATFC